MIGKLTRLESTNNNLRTQDIIGKYDSLPKVGDSFEMLAEPLVKDQGYSHRYIGTTPVKFVETLQTGQIQFYTQNSTYILTPTVGS